MVVLEVWCIKIIQPGAAYLYRAGTRVDHFSENKSVGFMSHLVVHFRAPNTLAKGTGLVNKQLMRKNISQRIIS